MPNTRQASRDQVLDVAARMFAARGFGETSLRQLIAETAMSPTAFYARYRSKHAVLEALVQRVLGQLLFSASAAFAQAHNMKDAIDGVARALHTVVLPQKEVVRLMMTEAPAVPTVRQALHLAYTGLARLVASYLTKIGARTPEAAAWAGLGAMHFQIMRWAVFEELDDAQLARELATAASLIRNSVR